MIEWQWPRLYLASRSPRRSALMDQAGIPYERLSLDFDESYPSEMKASEVPEYLARKKAQTAIDHIDEGIILTADSVVVQRHTVFGKPADRDEACAMINALADDMHLVITGVCLKSAHRERVFSSTTEVYLTDMSDDEIMHYVDSFEPYDKAGAYAIQEWIGHCKVKKIVGSYNNVMGLPTHLVYEALRHFPA